ncbi:UTP--glucose-1-phosphate uridylyltransferase [Populibacterium corticicola]|uniref:UTP--glucose-1-phosphate uridylyltransferase n=1 Tax=Populibacterium corticicola TaxID=1812826 RepID=A0ABW5XCT8_9MICO
MNTPAGLLSAQKKMRAAGVPDVAINVFTRFYGIVAEGKESFIRESEIDPLVDVVHLDSISDESAADSSASGSGDGRVGESALARTAMLKLNGGLGTSMGMQSAKSLLPVRDGLSFLDIIAHQVRAARAEHGVPLPILFMNSFRTDRDTRDALSKYEDLPVSGLPLTVVQNQEPKLRVSDLHPVEYPENPELEWCPPGHGDVYTVLQTSGVLDSLESAGYEFLNISNADNLGAYPSADIAEWFAQSGAPFVAETVQRTPADRKGGHVVVRDGQLILRETAQTHADDEDAAADISKHKYFNANTLWIRISALKELLVKHEGVLPLPLIQNHKTVNPSDPDSTAVVQLEFAMGAAIELFEGAQALVIDRTRFLPVKTTNDLLLLRSDVYELSDDYRLVPQGAEPLITLDTDYFKLIGDFEERFPAGAPLLSQASSLTVDGPWVFGHDVRVVGDGRLSAESGSDVPVPDGATVTETGIAD